MIVFEYFSPIMVDFEGLIHTKRNKAAEIARRKVRHRLFLKSSPLLP